MTVVRDRFDRFAERSRERFEELTSLLTAEAQKARARASTAATAPALNTDGLTEAENRAEEEFGEARLLALLESRREATGQALIADVIAEVLRFCGPVRPRDDMTLLALTREA